MIRANIISSGLQPGMNYAIYHVQCTVTTRGQFYLPSRFSTIIRQYPPSSGSHPFKDPTIEGSWAAMKSHAAIGNWDQAPPVFHVYMITLGLLLTSDAPGDFERLGIGSFIGSW
jgi:hypothetical protein